MATEKLVQTNMCQQDACNSCKYIKNCDESPEGDCMATNGQHYPKEFVLPEKWVVNAHLDGVELSLINNYFNKLSNSNYFTGNYHYYHFPDTTGAKVNTNYNRHTYRTIIDGYTEITFDQFKTYVLKEPIEKWSVGSYVLFLEDNVGNNQFKKGDIKKISQFICDRFDNGGIEYEGGRENDINHEKSNKLKWFATKSEAEEFAKTLVEPAKEEVKRPLKQAVHCKTQEEWDFACTIYGKGVSIKKSFGDRYNTFDYTYNFKGWLTKEHFINQNYQILSFKEWCEENGYKNASSYPKIENKCEFEVGDWVEVISNETDINKGCNSILYQIGVISKIDKLYDEYRNKSRWIHLELEPYDCGITSNQVRLLTPEEINNYLISIGQIQQEPVCTNTNSYRHDGCGEKYDCIQNCDECDYNQIPEKEILKETEQLFKLNYLPEPD